MLLPSRPPSIVRPGSLVLLAPTMAEVPQNFLRVDVDPTRHATVLAHLQRLRGHTYLRDGAITSEDLTSDGCHVQGADSLSWHVASLREDGSVAACARLRTHRADSAPGALGVWSSALARSAAWSDRLWSAIEADLTVARLRGVHYVEFGGWAVGDEWRRTTMAVTTAMATYALGECVGGFVGVTTATVRHCSSRMMRKLGGHSFTAEGVTVPSYFDPQYGCEMELLRFDSKLPAQRYGPMVGHVVGSLLDVPVLCASRAIDAWSAVSHRSLSGRARYTPVERLVPCLTAEDLAVA